MKKISLLLILSLVFFACQKGSPGPKGDPGESAKTFNFNLTFNLGDTYQEFNGISGFEAGDMVITYIYNESYGNESYYVQTPYQVGNLYFWTEVSESTGRLYVNVSKTDGSVGSAYTTSTTLSFKAILIKSTAIAANPDVDYTNYKEVVEAFDLVE